jgi:hypothetical protein
MFTASASTSWSTSTTGVEDKDDGAVDSVESRNRTRRELENVRPARAWTRQKSRHPEPPSPADNDPLAQAHAHAIDVHIARVHFMPISLPRLQFFLNLSNTIKLDINTLIFTPLCLSLPQPPVFSFLCLYACAATMLHKIVLHPWPTRSTITFDAVRPHGRPSCPPLLRFVASDTRVFPSLTI